MAAAVDRADDVACFRSATGIDDADLCAEILATHGWNVDHAINSLVSVSCLAPPAPASTTARRPSPPPLKSNPFHTLLTFPFYAVGSLVGGIVQLVVSASQIVRRPSAATEFPAPQYEDYEEEDELLDPPYEDEEQLEEDDAAAGYEALQIQEFQRIEEEERLRALEQERLERQALREQQDAAYVAALEADQEKERCRREEEERAKRKQEEEAMAIERVARKRQEKAISLEAEPEKGADVTEVLFRLPTGERKARRFRSSGAVSVLYDYVDSLENVGFNDGNYSLVSCFPRVVLGRDKLSSTLREAGLHPPTTLFIQVDSSHS